MHGAKNIKKTYSVRIIVRLFINMS